MSLLSLLLLLFYTYKDVKKLYLDNNLICVK